MRKKQRGGRGEREGEKETRGGGGVRRDGEKV